MRNKNVYKQYYLAPNIKFFDIGVLRTKVYDVNTKNISFVGRDQSDCQHDILWVEIHRNWDDGIQIICFVIVLNYNLTRYTIIL